MFDNIFEGIYKLDIKKDMESGKLPNPYLLTDDDRARIIDSSFGIVTKSDVGKLLFLRNGIIQMENEEQKAKREGNK